MQLIMGGVLFGATATTCIAVHVSFSLENRIVKNKYSASEQTSRTYSLHKMGKEGVKTELRKIVIIKSRKLYLLCASSQKGTNESSLV